MNTDMALIKMETDRDTDKGKDTDKDIYMDMGIIFSMEWDNDDNLKGDYWGKNYKINICLYGNVWLIMCTFT